MPPAEQDRPARAPVRNQFFEMAVYRTEFSKRLGQEEAPAGTQYLLVHLGAASVAAGAASQVDIDQYAFLIEDEVYHLRPVKGPADVPYLLSGVVRFIPGFTRRGVVAFLVPEQPGRLEFLLAASSMDPLSFVLTPNVQAKAQPRPARVIQDGDRAEIFINSVTWSDRIGDATAPDGRRYLVLDITIVNKEPRQGLVVDPGQFEPSVGQETFAPSSATEKLHRALVGERAVPAGRRARFEIAFEVPRDAQGLRLKYQGFTRIEEVPLP